MTIPVLHAERHTPPEARSRLVGPPPKTAGEAFSQLYTPEQVKAFEEAVTAHPRPVSHREVPALTLAQLEAVEATMSSMPEGFPPRFTLAPPEMDHEARPCIVCGNPTPGTMGVIFCDNAPIVAAMCHGCTPEGLPGFIGCFAPTLEPTLKQLLADERATRLETQVREPSRGFAEPAPPPTVPMNRHQRRAAAARKRTAKP